MNQLLVNVVTVSDLPAGETVTLAHLLASGGEPVTPTLVFPDRASTIVVTIVTATTVTFRNDGPSSASANFRCERGLSTEVDASTVAPMLWQGAAAGGGGGGGAPVDAPYVTAVASAPLTNERILSGSAGVDVTDFGPGLPIVVALKTTGVVAGSYANANITVDSLGRVTTAANGTAGGGTVSKSSADSGYVIPDSVSAVFWNSAGGNSQTFLPSPVGLDGKVINIKRTDTSLATLTVAAVAGNVEGGGTYIIAGGGGRISLSFQSDNANWWIV